MNKQARARWMLIASMAIFGTIGLMVRNIPVSSGELALYRAVMAAVLIGMYLLITKQKIPFGSIKKELPLFCAILLHAVALYLDYILIYLLNGWLVAEMKPILIFSAIFVGGFAVIWLLIYFFNRRAADRVNRKLRME